MSHFTSQEISFRVLANSIQIIQDFPAGTTTKTNGDGQRYLVTTDPERANQQVLKGNIEILNKQPSNSITKITIIEGALESDPAKYVLEIDIGEYGTITLAEAEIFSFNKFRQKYAAKFQKVLPQMSNAEWEAVISPLIEDAARVMDDTNEFPVVMDVLNRLENCVVVTTKEELLTGPGNRIWYDASTETRFMYSKDIETIAVKYNIELRRLAGLLSEFLKGPAKRTWIGKKFVQLWQFKKVFHIRDEGRD